ncbi:MAG: response regulator [Candidatus Omnitrophica bacterium]|nr:response regulator [Candidatus Omnitrophota bacterium]
MKKKKILLVDDEESFTMMVMLNLEETGFLEVRMENKGTKAFEAAKEFKPDLIFLDVIMPDCAGPDIANQLSEDEDTKNIPIVFLTAVVTQEEAAEKEGNIGGRTFIAKPVSVEKLLSFIKEKLKIR